MIYEITATSTFGVEAVLKKEIQNLGFKPKESANGKITFEGDERAVAAANLWLRTADRVYIRLAKFKAESFEELFQAAKKIDWLAYFPEDAHFIVIGTSARSTLHSVPACQSIIEKAIVSVMSEHYKKEWFDKNGARYTVRFSFQSDECEIYLDTSGTALHKRGYRVKDVPAPIKETMASALVQLSYFSKSGILVDPMCGSGTIAIEAAMIAKNIAPGLGRSFDAEKWSFIPQEIWKEERKKAFSQIDNNNTADYHIYASDIDQKTMGYARENAIEAGVDDIISFSARDIASLRLDKLPGLDGKAGSLVSNPPYGERIGEKEAIDGIYESIKRLRKFNPQWEFNIITPDKSFEKKQGRPADKRRKLYNGNIESCYYQYFGKKDE